MFPIAPGISYVDLNFRRSPGVIATGVLTGPGGVTIVDPGPTSCLETLTRALAAQGIAIADVRVLLVTHIHLDHAGATGTLVQQNPNIDVYVHERGAPHLTDPSKLLDSAGRLYGTQMGSLWGAVLPVPGERLKVLSGGERITVGSRTFDVAYTPGHASHHVSFFDRASGIAWVGDTAGVRLGPSQSVMPPTPPPDIDLELWDKSLSRIRVWEPSRLFLTHFGLFDAVTKHLDDLSVGLREVADMVRHSFEVGGSEEAQFAAFREEIGRYIRRRMSEHDAIAYETAAPLRFNWQGLARYWRKLRRP
ncbi:MAG TPA: MBL fold metallo-hydrolase [Vicinamibacterales bacterium]|jgi:glyoxylase-like metal-dependent hydrolase (beta-lactamase superfamily II)